MPIKVQRGGARLADRNSSHIFLRLWTQAKYSLLY